MREGGPSFCLGNPPHLVGEGEVVCRQCGTLAQDTLIGSYQVKRFLRNERGNQTYLATSEGQTQPVLVKLVPPDPASQHLWGRAWQEMHLLAELHHHSILPVLNCTVWNPGRAAPTGPVESPLSTTDKGNAFLMVVYQYIPLTFHYLIQTKGPISPQGAKITVERLLHIVGQVSAALAFAHSLGAVHGALEPGNVLLNTQLDHIWIADFGLARLQLPRSPFLAPELVSVGRVCEQRKDMTPYWEAITEASDQYALAVLCYQLFSHAIPQETFQRLLPILQRASQREPTSRFQRIADFSSALAAFGTGQPSWQEPHISIQQDRAQGIPDGGKSSFFPPSGIPAGASPFTPDQQAEQLEQLAGKGFLAHDYQVAVQAYLQALRLAPTRTTALSGLADTYFALERYPDALEAYGKVLDLDPNNAEAWFNQATLFDLLGRPDQAVYGYERAEQLRAEAARRQK
jgi:tetratricopeptide (TPR) repeat protein